MGATINLPQIPTSDDIKELKQFLIKQRSELEKWNNIISNHDHDNAVGSDFAQISNSGVSASATIAISKLAGGTDGAGSSGYLKLGNFMIQWGSQSITFVNSISATGAQITYPQAFKNGTIPKPLAIINHLALIGNVYVMIANDNTATTVTFIAYHEAAVTSGTLTLNWMAVGQWQ